MENILREVCQRIGIPLTDFVCFGIVSLRKSCEFWSAAALLPLFSFEGIRHPKRGVPMRFGSGENAKILQNAHFAQVLCFLLTALECALPRPLTSVHCKEPTDVLSPLESAPTKTGGGPHCTDRAPL
jgi:hypothetical protein